jgi:hypothetical protein
VAGRHISCTLHVSGLVGGECGGRWELLRRLTECGEAALRRRVEAAAEDSSAAARGGSLSVAERQLLLAQLMSVHGLGAEELMAAAEAAGLLGRGGAWHELLGAGSAGGSGRRQEVVVHSAVSAIQAAGAQARVRARARSASSQTEPLQNFREQLLQQFSEQFECVVDAVRLMVSASFCPQLVN